MAASASASASGGSIQWNTDDDSWSVRTKSKAAALAATFNHSWNMSADAKTCNAAAPSGPKFKTKPTTGYTWPSSNRKCGPGAVGSTAWADGSGYSVRDATSHWSRYKVYMTALADTKIGANGKASSDSTVNDPWHVDYPDTGNPKIHNLLIIQTSLGGSVTNHGRGGSPANSVGLGIKGTMGKLSASVDITTGKVSVGLRLAPGWVPYVGVRFPKSTKMPAPVAATKKDIRKLLEGLLIAGKGVWRSKTPQELIFVKDVGRSAGSADLDMDVFATQVAAGEEQN